MRFAHHTIRGRGVVAALLAVTIWTGLACSPSSLVDVQASSTVVDPSQVKTAVGATQLYNGAVLWFGFNLVQGYNPCTNDIVCTSALLTDELAVTGLGFDSQLGLDQRTMTTSGNVNVQSLYTSLHQARTRLFQARQALQLYASNTTSVPHAWQGQLYALEGYTIVYFAELFCSGIPLTTVPLVGAAQPTGGFTTQQLFEHAITLFDSAIIVGADSAQFVNLAKVGKGRALLGLGRFADAAAAVHDVPTPFVYAFTPLPTLVSNNLSLGMVGGPGKGMGRVQDHEGGSPMVWSTDPRTLTTTIPSVSGAMLVSEKYNVTAGGGVDSLTANPVAPIRVADGLEARLIEAEAALQAGDDSWLTILNDLRATCIGSAACAPVPRLTTANLPDTLTDPGSADARLDLVMKERAMWLYLTGHRQGDLRRLAHVYRRDPLTLWPHGIVSAPAFPPAYPDPPTINGTFYGEDVVYVPPVSERANNPMYTGCSDMNP